MSQLCVRRDPLTGNAMFLVASDEFLAFLDQAVIVEGEPGVCLGGHATGHDLEDLHTKEDEQTVSDLLDERSSAQIRVAEFGHGPVEQIV